jgi:hypothetical protein
VRFLVLVLNQDVTQGTMNTFSPSRAAQDVRIAAEGGILKSHLSAKMDATLTHENEFGTVSNLNTVLKATGAADLVPVNG